MTPAENAKELVNEFIPFVDTYHYGNLANAKRCAIIAVNAILKSGPRYPNEVDWDDAGGAHNYYYEAQREEADKYWKEVKQEIEKL
jgi:hypothetical protein